MGDPASDPSGKGQDPTLGGSLLAQDDPQAVDLLATHASLLREQLGEHYVALEDALGAYDFEAAAVALRTAANSS